LIPIAFEEAIARTTDRRRHLLLGNGFSIAAWPDFGYGALQSTVVGQSLRIDALFHRFQTVDFERIGRALLEARTVLSVHAGTEALADQLAADYRDLRRLLVMAITRIHPAAPAALEGRFQACADFLEDFIGVARRPLWGSVFTTNYDLLLYWTLMRRVDDLAANDGFRGKPLVWHRQTMQMVFYLHGALHLFEVDGVTQKLSAPGRLVDTVGKRIAKDDVPLFISEGSSQEKRVRIAESDYLTAAPSACRRPVTTPRPASSSSGIRSATRTTTSSRRSWRAAWPRSSSRSGRRTSLKRTPRCRRRPSCGSPSERVEAGRP
jgi:hypothetical protein